MPRDRGAVKGEEVGVVEKGWDRTLRSLRDALPRGEWRHFSNVVEVRLSIFFAFLPVCAVAAVCLPFALLSRFHPWSARARLPREPAAWTGGYRSAAAECTLAESTLRRLAQLATRLPVLRKIATTSLS